MQAVLQATPGAPARLGFSLHLRKAPVAAAPCHSRLSLEWHSQFFNADLQGYRQICPNRCKPLKYERKRMVGSYSADNFYSSGAATVDDPVERNKRAQVSRRLADTGRHFKRLGSLGFWGQLVCSVVSATILAFAILISGNATAPLTGYLTAAGIASGFLSVFWSFGYLRMAGRLQAAVNDPSKAPPRSEVSSNIKQGLIINLLGMGATLLGMQATVGLLVGKALTSPAAPFLQGPSKGYSPVLALDVFLVQVCICLFPDAFTLAF
ncbi:hypothetical protein O6H91_Y537900 [Diphasiastrum complanatum]|nr:hypothetical protein O6H91_Y537900 [Diphasiastrum complanatum]